MIFRTSKLELCLTLKMLDFKVLKIREPNNDQDSR